MKENKKESKMKEVIGYEEIGFDYDVCNELYEGGCGKDIEGRLLDVEFLKIMFEDVLEDEDDEVINKMFESIKDLNDEVLVEF
jgi:hypothetical protein